VNLDQQDKQWILDQLKATQRQTADLVTGMKESLEREIASVKESFEREMRQGFERIEKVSTRHTGLIASGTLAIGTLIKSAQKQDAAIAKLEARMRKLEGRKNGRKR
jgi:hypothetical protein